MNDCLQYLLLRNVLVVDHQIFRSLYVSGKTAQLTKYSLLTLCLPLTKRSTTREPRYEIGDIEYNSFLVVNFRYRPLYSKKGATDENSTKLRSGMSQRQRIVLTPRNRFRDKMLEV